MKKIIFSFLLFWLFIPLVFANENVKYYKTTYYPNYTSTIEVAKDEYDNQFMPYSLSLNTAYKSLSIMSTPTTVIMKTTWKNTPKYKSYDVIAIRGEGVIFPTESMIAMQVYDLDNIIRYYDYTANTKLFNDGIGVSMNLVDSATDFTLSIEVPYIKYSNNATIYGTYQHAVKNVSLSDSQNYTLSANGYGQVVSFDSSISSYYDATGGVYINV